MSLWIRLGKCWLGLTRKQPKEALRNVFRKTGIDVNALSERFTDARVLYAGRRLWRGVERKTAISRLKICPGLEGSLESLFDFPGLRLYELAMAAFDRLTAQTALLGVAQAHFEKNLHPLTSVKS